MTPVSQGDFQVGEWKGFPSLNEIHNGGEVRHLEPKAMDVLCYMAQHAEEVLTKQRLIQAVWPDQPVGELAERVAKTFTPKAFYQDSTVSRLMSTN